jgi:hypothetical protein
LSLWRHTARRSLLAMMKHQTCAALVLALVLGASAQDKPRVFISGKGTTNVATNASGGGNHWFASGRANSTVGAHDESMEITKDLQQSCSGVTVTLNQAAADYTVQLDRESKQNRGLLRTNSQVQVSNRIGDVLGSKATRTVNNASKDACSMIVSDWAQHGRIDAPVAPQAPQQAAAQSAPSPAPMQAAPVQEAAPVRLVVPTAPVLLQTAAPQSGFQATGDGVSLGEASRLAKQRTACLRLAESNPSITCK